MAITAKETKRPCYRRHVEIRMCDGKRKVFPPIYRSRDLWYVNLLFASAQTALAANGSLTAYTNFTSG